MSGHQLDRGSGLRRLSLGCERRHRVAVLSVRAWQVYGEGAALLGRAYKRDFAAQQPHQLAAYRRAEAGAAVLARGRAIGLGERLEDQLLLFGGDTDAGVCDADRDYLSRPAERVVAEAPAAFGRAQAHRHAALLGELECIRDEVLQHLAKPA